MCLNQLSLLIRINAIGVVMAIVIFMNSGAVAVAQEVSAKTCLEDFLMNAELSSMRYAFAAESETVETDMVDVGLRSWFSLRITPDNKEDEAIEYFDVRRNLLLGSLQGAEERALIHPRKIFYAYGRNTQDLREYPKWGAEKKAAEEDTGMRMMYRTPNLFTFCFMGNTSFTTKHDSIDFLRKLISTMKMIKEDEDAKVYRGYWGVDRLGIKVQFSKEPPCLPMIVEGFYKKKDGEVLGDEEFEELYPKNKFKVVTKWKRLDNELYYPIAIANTVYRVSPKSDKGREMHVLVEWSNEVPDLESLTVDSLNAEISNPGKVLKLQALLEERLAKRKGDK